ncbi:transposase [Streptosporangium sp. DT93]|uniref:transposase n=1 Tax=Streptosporangium sp. DT93 TaxID=3393428 RepID=UPI003CEB22DC
MLSRPDRTITSIARDLGVSRETLRVWVHAAQAHGEDGASATTMDKAASNGNLRSEGPHGFRSRAVRQWVG